MEKTVLLSWNLISSAELSYNFKENKGEQFLKILLGNL